MRCSCSRSLRIGTEGCASVMSGCGVLTPLTRDTIGALTRLAIRCMNRCPSTLAQWLLQRSTILFVRVFVSFVFVTVQIELNILMVVDVCYYYAVYKDFAIIHS